ncbi:Gx transporter family protein [Geoalkalibacter halelectricus]|uniref:Gx transporter family protein n=1 Tax=Geoalkalibacter halelectricus TaxID=2847045 RepID=A0ABY5ZM87_9BACT|nr:Gx transporter family protein [Geoalkalibacter halelectricus]MDO3378398.1 Gx transporter family protein [Geoalkalibacter halelectricus]UWZ80282.1 Gx transporter family protein [Geoalkalibacter halelectricus]
MTSSAIDPMELARCRRRVFLALFTALAVALHTLEYLLPAPAPWFRFGFANILTLCALYLFDARAAWTLSLARVVVGSLILGNLFAPGFFLSLGGAVAAVSLMTGAKALAGARLGPVGASVLGAMGHACGQMLIAWALLVRHDGLWLLLPFFLLISLLTGLVNGFVASLLIEALRGHRAFSPADAARGARLP